MTQSLHLKGFGMVSDRAAESSNQNMPAQEWQAEELNEREMILNKKRARSDNHK